MRVPRILRRAFSLSANRSTPLKLTLPPAIRQPGRVKPRAARPSVDLPAPDSPISPSTSPRRSERLIPLTIGCQAPELSASTTKSRMSRSSSPVWRAPVSCGLLVIAQSACNIEEPVDDEVDADGQKRDRSRRQQRRDVSVADECRAFAHHRAPVGRRRLNAEAEEGKRRYRQEHEAETQPEFRKQRRQDIRQDLPG